jgi:hypothetical protein
MDFLAEDVQSEKLLAHLLNCAEADPVSDVLKHSPALESMKMLIQPLMLMRDELFTTC